MLDVPPKRRPESLVFAVLIAVVALSPTINLILGMGGASGDGSSVRVLLYSFILLMAIGVTVKKRERSSWWPIPIGVTVCILWFSISLLWALNPAVGARRLALTIAIVWAVFALTRAVGPSSAFDVARIVFAGVVIGNYVAVFAFPQVGLTDDTYAWLAGAWRGVLGEKNHAGAVCALTVLLFLFDARHIRAWIRFVIIVAAAYFLYRTSSKTSLGLTFASILFGFSASRYNPYYRVLALAFIVCLSILMMIGMAAYGQSIMEFVNAYMDDPEALTGRVQIWPVLWSYFESHWLLGAGFGSFWNIGPDSPIFQSDGWVTEIASGHNGYLDLLVQIGLPGLLLILLATLFYPVVVLTWRHQVSGARTGLVAAILLFCFAHNFTESTLFDRDSIVFVFVLLCVASVWQELKVSAPLLRSTE